MADTEAGTKILSTSALRRYFVIKHSGTLHVERKKWHFLSKTKWDERYFVIAKGAKNDRLWEFFCFENQLADKQEWALLMSDMESARQYDIKNDKDFVGIRIKFIEARKQELILRCDTDKNREGWLINLLEAISEAHSDSTDSGFESGGSRRYFRRDAEPSFRQSDKYDTIDETDYEKDISAKAGYIAKGLIIYVEAAHIMRRSDFKKRRIGARSITHLLTIEQKVVLVRLSKQFHKYKSRSFANIIIGDETWVYLNELKRKIQYKIWAIIGSQDLAEKKKTHHERQKAPIAAEEQSSVAIADAKSSDSSKRSDVMFGKKKKTGCYENVQPNGTQVVEKDNSCRNCEGEINLQSKLSVQVQEDDCNKCGFSANAFDPLKTVTEETHVKEIIEKSIEQESEGTAGMQSIPRSVSFASLRRGHGESSEYFKSSIKDEKSYVSQKRNVCKNESCWNKARCRGSCSSNCSSGSDSVAVEQPFSLTEDFKENEYLYKGNSLNESITNEMPMGTFLVQVKEKGMRLHVVTPKGIMCFKIYTKDDQLSLFKLFNVPSAVFGSLKEFLLHYSVHYLPKDEYSVRLTRGYKEPQKVDS